MEIQGPGHIHEVRKIVPDKPVETTKQSQTTQSNAKEDTVLISDVSKYLNQIHSLPDVRQEKIDKIKEEIEIGGYLTDEKLDATIDKILEELGE